MTKKFFVRHCKPLPFGWEWNWLWSGKWIWYCDKMGTADLRGSPVWGVCYYFHLGWLSIWFSHPVEESYYNILEGGKS